MISMILDCVRPHTV